MTARNPQADRASRPFSSPRAYVREHRSDLLYLLKNGEPYVRALALYVLIKGGQDADWELVEREVQLAQELGDDVLEEVMG